MAKPAQLGPADAQLLREVRERFAGRSSAERFLGPSWIDEEGVARLVMVTGDDRWPRFYRKTGSIFLVLWCWPADSVFLSASCLAPKGAPAGPSVRWFGDASLEVAQQLHDRARFRLLVVGPSLDSSWFEAGVGDIINGQRRPGRRGLDYLFSIRDSSVNRDGTADLVADFWSVLQIGSPPWRSELSSEDNARGAWANVYSATRRNAVRALQKIAQRSRPFIQEGGEIDPELAMPDGVRQELQFLMRDVPELGTWITCCLGSHPEAGPAIEAGMAVLRNPRAAMDSLKLVSACLARIEDGDMVEAVMYPLLAALTSAESTDAGLRRPWLRNDRAGGLVLSSSPLDPTLDPQELRMLWQAMAEPPEILDAGLWAQPTDVPVPYEALWGRCEDVRLACSVAQAEDQIAQLLFEAQQARQWSAPQGARVEVRIGPFVGVRLHETSDGEFACIFLDGQERYFAVWIGLTGTVRARCHPIYSTQPDCEDPNEEASAALRLVAAAIVRDFLVVEQREAVFVSRPFRRRIRGRDIRTIVYVPRVRYERPVSDQTQSADGEPPRPAIRHAVSQHLRRSDAASPAQLLMAMRFGVHVPKGFTFVRPHERGGQAGQERMRIYRSRSASRMLFQAVEVAPAGNRPKWFDFERACARLLQRQGMQVVHQSANRNGDDGVDLYATDEEGFAWVVQCKCWSLQRTVGPDVIRELAGAIELVATTAHPRPRGMVVATCGFTPRAVTTASQLGVRLIDGAQLAPYLSAAATA